MFALPFLLEICLPSPWSPPFPLHASALILLALAKVRLSPTLTLSLLMNWYSGQTVLFLFLLARAAPVSYYLTLVLSSLPCPLLHLSSYLKLCGRSGRNCLLSHALSRYNGSPDTRFYRATTRLMSWPDGVCYLRPPLSLVVSRIHSCLFSDWRRTVLSNFFDTEVPSISTEELVLPRHARCVLSRFRFKGHSLSLGSYLYRVGKIENPFCSACGHSSQDTSHFILHCSVTDSLRRLLFGDSLTLYDLWSKPWGVAWLLGLHGLPPCPPPSEGIG